MNENKMKELFDSIGAGAIYDVLEKQSWQQKIVEEEIRVVMRQHKDDMTMLANLYGAFSYCRPELDLSERLLRLHVQEMLSRVVAGKEQDHSLTDSELLQLVMMLHLSNPHNKLGHSIFVSLFNRLFPERTSELQLQIHPEIEQDKLAAGIAKLKEEFSKPRAAIDAYLPDNLASILEEPSIDQEKLQFFADVLKEAAKIFAEKKPYPPAPIEQPATQERVYLPYMQAYGTIRNSYHDNKAIDVMLDNGVFVQTLRAFTKPSQNGIYKEECEKSPLRDTASLMPKEPSKLPVLPIVETPKVKQLSLF